MQELPPYVIVPLGTHMLALLKHNSRNVVAAIDPRNNGSLQKAGINTFVDKIYSVGAEDRYPIISFFSNRRYYQSIAKVLDDCLFQYPECKFILTANYTPFTRFVIDYVGPNRIELWEDGLNHYIKLESIIPNYRFKELVKVTAGFYARGLFNVNYKGDELQVFDRFEHQNLNFPVSVLPAGGKYYIGQPLIEDSLINEAHYKRKLEKYFSNTDVIYLPHPREKQRIWLDDIFTIERPSCSAEDYLKQQGASAVYSAFSTVNVNVECDENVFLANYLGLKNVAGRLNELMFNAELI